MVLISIKCLLFFMCLFFCICVKKISYNNSFEQRIYKIYNLINIRINRTLSSLSSTQDKKKLRKTPLNLKSKDDLNQNKNFITTSDNKGKKERN
ncbi:hypothetical protein C923_04295 [Plasmodium falciparum UGT5.1]|uniref:PYST-C1-like N-terminal domain-containing protein n=7 Tax=Plasmodium falciparum TaxID=5833 RepID=A0A024VXX4_PLAFA|nr:hypothetical protein PFFVO_05449 [Plasmodium falciparum Vietnam Oak-Knoll (FVO)]ETW28830.1 hypothetical protein PFFCH_03750 [Plasmodium falciparum FCH/4]ETW33529.1 hypothetical protein PFTANZ_05777 [Plasmodium falciparum Tanzania (2000708)]ETW40212.1 hypothetical protein PFNF135_05440 [Plasmodium falciparum NF135/5.C10]ETW46392.1 hypothetical protein PFMALIP_05634 [Plasmodium falciparum MaliPS096_E11]EUR62158.1 hypothetical protein PFBG_05872 [Plasmodium falciparum 7G8]EWC75024.1 hypotheti